MGLSLPIYLKRGLDPRKKKCGPWPILIPKVAVALIVNGTGTIPNPGSGPGPKNNICGPGPILEHEESYVKPKEKNNEAGLGLALVLKWPQPNTKRDGSGPILIPEENK